MKILLGILCGLMLLFSGGCTLMLGGLQSAGPLPLIPVAVFVLNALILAALFGMARPFKPAFYFLAVVDVLFAAAILLGATIGLSSSDAELVPWALLIVAAFGAKGVLTWLYVRNAAQ